MCLNLPEDTFTINCHCSYTQISVKSTLRSNNWPLPLAFKMTLINAFCSLFSSASSRRGKILKQRKWKEFNARKLLFWTFYSLIKPDNLETDNAILYLWPHFSVIVLKCDHFDKCSASAMQHLLTDLIINDFIKRFLD